MINSDDEIVEPKEQLKILMIGESGVGKSSLGNFLLKKNWFDKIVEYFKVGNGKESETCNVQHDQGLMELDNGNIILLTIIDTPGLNDTKERDKEIYKQICDYLKESSSIDAVFYVNNFEQPRKFPKDRELFQNLVTMFGKDALKTRLYFILTHGPNMKEWEDDDDAKQIDQTKMETAKKDIRDDFRKFVGAENPQIYFINSKDTKVYKKMYEPTFKKMINDILQIKRIYGSIQTQALKADSLKIKNSKNPEIEKLEREKKRLEEEKQDYLRWIQAKTEEAATGKRKKIWGWFLLPVLPASIPLIVKGSKQQHQALDKIDEYNKQIRRIDSELNAKKQAIDKALK